MFNIRCPYCGGYSIQERTEEATGDDSTAKYVCTDCTNTFGVKSTDSTVFPDKHCDSLFFTYGGFFEGHQSLTITEQDGYAEMMISPPYSEFEENEIKMRITLEEWRTIKHTLFYELFVLSWDEEYHDPHIMDGTQWELTLGFDDRETFKVTGSNDFPALYKELIWHIKPYFEEVD